MKIKKGKWYMCIEDLFHISSWYDDPAKHFVKGKVYFAERDNCFDGTEIGRSEAGYFRFATKDEIPKTVYEGNKRFSIGDKVQVKSKPFKKGIIRGINEDGYYVTFYNTNVKAIEDTNVEYFSYIKQYSGDNLKMVENEKFCKGDVVIVDKEGYKGIIKESHGFSNKYIVEAIGRGWTKVYTDKELLKVI